MECSDWFELVFIILGCLALYGLGYCQGVAGRDKSEQRGANSAN